MVRLEVVLNDLEEVAAGFKEASTKSDDERKRLVVSGRQKLSALTRDLVTAVSADKRLASHPELAADFKSRMTNWRHSMARFQTRWRPADGDFSSSDYRGSVADLRQSNAEFLAWCRQF
jgi:hypothetical protein